MAASDLQGKHRASATVTTMASAATYVGASRPSGDPRSSRPATQRAAWSDRSSRYSARLMTVSTSPTATRTTPSFHSSSQVSRTTCWGSAGS